MPPKYQSVCIVGGGIAGVSLSRCLAAQGVRVTLLERSAQLCAGATWHAAGLVTRFAGSAKLKKLHVRSLNILNELQQEGDGIGLHTPGSIRLIEKGNEARYLEAKQQVGMAAMYDEPGLETRFIGPEEIQALHPLIDIESIECAIWTAEDGDVDPTSLTNCLARKAKAHGAQYKLKTRVDKIEKVGDGFEILCVDSEGNEDTITADAVVNAAGLWSMEVSDMVQGYGAGKPNAHPAMLIEHQYAISEPIKAIQDLGDYRLPVLRDLAGSAYIRQEGKGLLIGPYETDCLETCWGKDAKAPPAGFGMELFGGELERITDNLMAAVELIPPLGEVGFSSVVNGPTIWTGDSLPRCGRTTVPGYYDFNSLSYGITHAPPLSEYLSHIMLNGEQPFDMAAQCDPLRYGNWATPAYVEAKVKDSYTKNNTVAFEHENRGAGREFVPQKALQARLAEQNAVFAFGGGVESVAFYREPGQNANLLKIHQHDWESNAANEAAGVLSGVGVSFASFSKMRVRGEGATQFLLDTTTNMLPKKAGGCKLTYALTPTGKIVAEFTVCKMADDDFYVVGSMDYKDHDLQWLRDSCSQPAVSIEDLSEQVQVLHVAGPESDQLMQNVCNGIDGQKFFTMRQLQAADSGDAFNCFKLSFSGEAGYELHVDHNSACSLYDRILAAGQEMNLQHFGNYALNSMRIEKGYALKADLDYAHYTEAGIGPFLSKKRQFVGRDDEYIPKRRHAKFSVATSDGWGWSVPGDSPIRATSDDSIVGVVTTSAFGARSQQTIALGYLFNNHNKDQDVYIESFGNRWDATEIGMSEIP